MLHDAVIRPARIRELFAYLGVASTIPAIVRSGNGCSHFIDNRIPALRHNAIAFRHIFPAAVLHARFRRILCRQRAAKTKTVDVETAVNFDDIGSASVADQGDHWKCTRIARTQNAPTAKLHASSRVCVAKWAPWADGNTKMSMSVACQLRCTCSWQKMLPTKFGVL